LNNSPKLLLVEDEALIRFSLAEALSEAGYQLIECGDGEQAIALLLEHDTLAGVVTDIRLGGKADGWEVARQARKALPRIAVVYMSGDSAADWTFDGVPNSIMVQKPFAVAQIVTAVSTLLNAVDMSPTQPTTE
jgi:DNA-binding response OmpR family regulator